MTDSTVIGIGNTYRVYDSAVVTYEQLPVATYRIDFSPQSGFSLDKVADLEVGDEKLYGNHRARLERILRTYDRFRDHRSLGVMFSGDKGMGKSLMLRLLAQAAITRLDLPVVLVTSNYKGVAEFIDSLGPALVIFDEFEKVFPLEDEDCMNAQNQFLGLFDGLSTSSRIYALSINNTAHVSSYLINRPGRFHYHMRFDYPGPDEVRAYLADQAPDMSTDEVDKIVTFIHRMPLNYDHLRAIAFELSDGVTTFEEALPELNIKRDDRAKYIFTLTMADGQVYVDTDYFDVFGTSVGYDSLSLYSGDDSVRIRLRARDLVSGQDGTLHLPADRISDHILTSSGGDPVSLTVTPAGQTAIGF